MLEAVPQVMVTHVSIEVSQLTVSAPPVVARSLVRTPRSGDKLLSPDARAIAGDWRSPCDVLTRFAASVATGYGRENSVWFQRRDVGRSAPSRADDESGERLGVCVYFGAVRFSLREADWHA